MKTKQWRRIHPPPPPPCSSGDLNSLKSTKRFFFKCFDSADCMNFCLQKCWHSALVAQEPWAIIRPRLISMQHNVLSYTSTASPRRLVRARYEEHHRSNRVSTHLKYLILTLKTGEAEPRPDGPTKSTILAPTSVRILSLITMKLPLHPENRLNTVSPLSAVETCSSQLCFPHLEDVQCSFHTVAGLLLRFPRVEPSNATFTLQDPNFGRIGSEY